VFQISAIFLPLQDSFKVGHQLVYLRL
jgi:hypothetical protein